MARAKSARSGAGALARSPSQLLHRAQQLALDIYAEELGPAAVTQRQFALLTAVAAYEGATQSDLVRVTGIDRSTLADMAARMIGKGLLARERSTSDARANAVRLTPAGRAALEDAAPKVARADARLLKLLGEASRRQGLVGLLRDLVMAGEALQVPPPAKAAKVAPPRRRTTTPSRPASKRANAAGRPSAR